MLSKKDLASIKELMREETSGIREEISNTKEDITGMKKEISDMKEDITDMKEEIMGVKKDITDMKEDIIDMKEDILGVKGETSGMKEEISCMKVQISDMQRQMVTKEEFGRLEQEVHELRDYSHQKFMLIENEVMPKISILFEMTDFYVKETECQNRRERIDGKLNCLDPLKAIVKSHSKQLAKHDEKLNQFITNAG